MNKNNLYVILFMLVVIYVMSFVTEFAIYVNNKSRFGNNNSCPTFFENTTSLTMTKNIKIRWNLQYTFSEGIIEQICPTITHDVNIKISKTLVAYSDEKMPSYNYIFDCNEKILMIVRIISGVSYEFIDIDETTILGYSSGILLDNVDIIDSSDNVVAHITWKLLEWNIVIYNTSSRLSDFRVLAIMAGKNSFKDYDTCNIFFWIIAYVWICMSIIAVLTLVIYLCRRRHYNHIEMSLPLENERISYI